MSTIAALTSNGMLCGATFDGTTDTETLVLFVEEFLAPHLKPGQILVMDNLSAHKSKLVEARGARVLGVPPYSPNFNPIKMPIASCSFATVRSCIDRSSVLIFQIATAMASITMQDAINYVQHCRYADTNG